MTPIEKPSIQEWCEGFSIGVISSPVAYKMSRKTLRKQICDIFIIQKKKKKPPSRENRAVIYFRPS